MIQSGTVYLMYHELEMPGRRLCRDEEGYARYVITQSDFRAHLAYLKANGFRGMSVTEALDRNDHNRPAVAITFDDGCETDLLVAAPMLEEAGFNATFYIVAGFTGERGYLSERQLRELSDSGFEIGCHSMTHSYLTDLDADRLRFEIAEAKDRLEQITGKRVEHFSCPGGRWNHRVARTAEEAGYRSVVTSRAGVNSQTSDRFCLTRVAIKRGIEISEFDRLCRAEGMIALRAKASILSAAKFMLGNSVYEKVRSALLDKAGN
ncbi:MAG: polysaccharide deacetylase family protein [Blastocatellia bacterium]|nr:polysaccharide deacetylase family protein [Blastocatellia bacterium]